MNKRKVLMQNILLSMLSLVVLFLIAELSLRAVYYQAHGNAPFAVLAGLQEMRHKVVAWKASKHAKDRLFFNRLCKTLYSEKGGELLRDFMAFYEEEFAKLVAEVKKGGAALIVVYIPSDDYTSKPEAEASRDFFYKLASKYGADYVDLTEEFLKYPEEYVTLLPEDGHLSRFGNRLVAEALVKKLEKYQNYKAHWNFLEKRPIIMGDLKSKNHNIWSYEPNMPYRVVTNSQGFRMKYDLSFPKTKQRLLVLGDSVTFGPYGPNEWTYPYLLEKVYGKAEIVNAGVCGYTITDEVSLFQEKAKYTEPDIVIIQVLDNDITDFFSYKRNLFARKMKAYYPSEKEAEFIRAVE